MLILTRNPGEAIIINNNIKIIVLGHKTHGGKIAKQIRIGIEAPDEISVNREEIQEKINNQKELESQ